MITVFLTRSDNERAHAREAELKERRQGSSNTIWSKQNKDFIGALAEISFEKYLIDIKLDFRPHKDYTGKCGDLWDYVVKVDGKDFFFDVKGSEKYETASANEKQAAKAAKFPNLLLAAVKVKLDFRGEGEEAEIIGYAPATWLEVVHAKRFTNPKTGEVVELWQVPARRLIKFKENDRVVF